jgi:Holliday junction resolvase RusA-like endonuclease
MDSLTVVKVWKDDAQVFETLAGKYYAHEKRTGAQIIIETFKEGMN